MFLQKISDCKQNVCYGLERFRRQTNKINGLFDMMENHLNDETVYLLSNLINTYSGMFVS
jgi:hypothetical protein